MRYCALACGSLAKDLVPHVKGGDEKAILYVLIVLSFSGPDSPSLSLSRGHTCTQTPSPYMVT